MKRRKIILTSVCTMMLICAAGVLSLDGAIAAETETEASSALSFDLKEAGVGFDLPEEFSHLKGILLPDYGMEMGDDSGLYLSALEYVAISQDKYDELNEKSNTEEGLSEEEYDYLYERMANVLIVYTVDEEKVPENAEDALTEIGVPTEGMKKLGNAGSYGFYLYVSPPAKELGEEYQFDDGFREEYDALIKACEDPSWIRIYEPVYPAAGQTVSFETTDLEGNQVRSEDIFKESRITMINLWGTFCGPCISEMPDLEELRRRLEEKDCSIIGVVVDVSGPEDSKHIRSAEEIIGETGVTYLNLLPWETIDNDLPANAIPTTYFVDQNGKVIGKAAVGARGADDYETLVDARLEELDQ